ncbi:MAG TPA: carboxylesterase family protein [Silvibacterium sp.]|nr:carboxylesterase family protein [Silvibacterium sp.]
MRTALLLALLIPTTLSAQLAAPHVRIAQGELAGEVTTLGPDAFKGIPYAAPPIGPLRWQPPQPAPSWQGVRDASTYGHACMQPPFPIFHIPPSSMSEDCLYLNIWTTNLRPENPAPVLVFIHGGGFLIGAGSQAAYDGSRLAARGAVLVTINYRLGIFGFFAHPDLTAASPHHASGNYGLLDQIAALRWVRRNIAAFGGDPHNVTVFGESAGAISIGDLIVSPPAAGLFDKAILESPALLFTPTPELRKSYDGIFSAEAAGLAVAPHVADLQNLPAAEIMQRAYAAVPKGTGHAPLSPTTSLDGPTPAWLWVPIVDGYVIPDQPAKLYAIGRHARIPTLAGTNANEGNLFLTHYHPDSTASFTDWVNQTFGSCAKSVLKQYGPATPQQAHASADRLITDALFLHSTYLFAKDTHGYLYRFTHVSPFGASSGLGAFHGSEIAYVFGLTDHPAEKRLSDQIMTMWLHFARTGDPNLMNSSEWTRIGSNGEISYMDFDDTFSVKPFPDATFSAFADPQFCRASQFASVR